MMTITEPKASPSTCRNTPRIFSWALEPENNILKLYRTTKLDLRFWSDLRCYFPSGSLGSKLIFAWNRCPRFPVGGYARMHGWRWGVGSNGKRDRLTALLRRKTIRSALNANLCVEGNAKESPWFLFSCDNQLTSTGAQLWALQEKR